jgi:hypothetical protein
MTSNYPRVDTTTPLEQPEKQANITIEATPAGLAIKVEYTGSLSSIPAAIERLRSAGVLDLVQVSAPATAAPTAPVAKSDKTTPTYDSAGEACCPVHGKKLNKRPWGWSCSALAKDGQVADSKGYCGLKFEA